MDKKHTVLCVDDEKKILKSLERLLRREKYKLLTAQSGFEGLEVLREFKAHLIISDHKMPEMSGTEFLKRVRDKFPETIRIILSGSIGDQEIIKAVNERDVHQYFPKPWNDNDLKSEIRRLLNQL